MDLAHTDPMPARRTRSEKRQRPEMVGFRLNQDERARLALIAEQYEVSVAEFVRRAVMRYLTVATDDPSGVPLDVCQAG